MSDVETLGELVYAIRGWHPDEQDSRLAEWLTAHDDRVRREAKAEGAKAVLDAVEPLFGEADEMDPSDYKVRQGHLPPAFREINYRAAFMALAILLGKVESAARAAAEQVSGE